MHITQVRSVLADRLQARHEEIEGAILSRVSSLSGGGAEPDPDYAHGLRESVAAALDYAIDAFANGEEGPPHVPATLLAQSRLAARRGIGLDMVLRRYFAASALLSDFMIEEAERGGLEQPAALRSLMRLQTSLLDQIAAAVATEYQREQHRRVQSTEQRRADRVARLLAGQPVDTGGLEYPFARYHHIGLVIAAGEKAIAVLRNLASDRDRRLLSVSPEEGTVWAWLGSRTPLPESEPEALLAADWPAGVPLAVGEPAADLSGWRLTHRQAKAAFSVTASGSSQPVRYADVALSASLMRDELLMTSLRKLYLDRLSDEPDGEVLQETLRAYFTAGMNATAAASALGVGRRTVANRLRTTERRLGRPLTTCYADVDLALQLRHLTLINYRNGQSS
jgi:hypothetical protein